MVFLRADRRDTGDDVVACVSGKLINFIGHYERCLTKSSGSLNLTRNDRKYHILAILPLSEVFFKPKFQGQKGPDMRGKVDAGGCVGMQDILDGGAFEKIPFHELAVEELLSRVVFEFSSEPGIDRNAEAHLGAEHDLFGDDSAERFFEDIFFVV